MVSTGLYFMWWSLHVIYRPLHYVSIITCYLHVGLYIMWWSLHAVYRPLLYVVIITCYLQAFILCVDHNMLSTCRPLNYMAIITCYLQAFTLCGDHYICYLQPTGLHIMWWSLHVIYRPSLYVSIITCYTFGVITRSTFVHRATKTQWLSNLNTAKIYCQEKW